MLSISLAINILNYFLDVNNYIFALQDNLLTGSFFFTLKKSNRVDKKLFYLYTCCYEFIINQLLIRRIRSNKPL